MKLLIFGSTGETGRQLVEQSLEQGHIVTAFARNPQKLDIEHENLTVFQGDVMDLTSVQEAVRGQDAVLCVLGSGQKRTGAVRSEGTRHIIHAMEQVGIRRLICQTTLGAGDSWENLNFFWKYMMFGFLLREVFADHQLQENYVKQSHLDWTIVRPGAFVKGNRTGHYRHGFSSNDKTTKLKISRADVAEFILKQLANHLSIRQTPSISY